MLERRLSESDPQDHSSLSDRLRSLAGGYEPSPPMANQPLAFRNQANNIPDNTTLGTQINVLTLTCILGF